MYDLLTGAFLEHDYPLTEVPSSNISAFIDVGSTEADNNVGIKGIFIDLEGFDATFWDYSYTEKPLTSDVVATLDTNVSTFGDATKRKFCNYLTAYLKQTEQTQDANGLLDQSSCKIRVAWDFADSITSNKYSSEFQAYRLRRVNVSETSSYDHGHSVVVTRNKVRGSGKALSVRIRSELGKQCHLYGLNLSVYGNSNT